MATESLFTLADAFLHDQLFTPPSEHTHTHTHTRTHTHAYDYDYLWARVW